MLRSICRLQALSRTFNPRLIAPLSTKVTPKMSANMTIITAKDACPRTFTPTLLTTATTSIERLVSIANRHYHYLAAGPYVRPSTSSSPATLLHTPSTPLELQIYYTPLMTQFTTPNQPPRQAQNPSHTEPVLLAS